MFKVFVYGSLRKGLSNDINNMAELLGAEIEFLGVDTIEAEMYSLTYFPAISFKEGSDNNVQVLGEVYEVKTKAEDMLETLDVLEGYPSFYNRKEIDTEFGKAWVYFIEKPLSTSVLLDTGNWMEYIETKLSKKGE